MDNVYWFESLQYWHWFSAGLVFLILELFLPGAVFLWLGIAGLLIGCLVWLVPELSWQWQLVLFAVISVTDIVAWRLYCKRQTPGLASSGLNRRGQSLVGRQAPLEQAIRNGIGYANIDDTRWRVQGPELPEGTMVRIVAAEGTTLRVEPVKGE